MNRLYWFLIIPGIIFSKEFWEGAESLQSDQGYQQKKKKKKKNLIGKYYYEMAFLSCCWPERTPTAALRAEPPQTDLPLMSISLLSSSPPHSLLLESLSHCGLPGIISTCSGHSWAVSSAWGSAFQIASQLMPSPPWRDLLWPCYGRVKSATPPPPSLEFLILPALMDVFSWHYHPLSHPMRQGSTTFAFSFV